MRTARGLIIFPGALGDLICLLPAIQALAWRFSSIEFELMARTELARFAVRRMPLVAGHSIDRFEVAGLFSENGGESNPARNFFGQFQRIDCFFASDDERFRSSLRQAAHGEVAFYPFRPPGTSHVAEGYLRAIGAPVLHPLRARIEVAAEDVRDARQRLHRLALEPGGFVLILPGSGSVEKNWPVEKFVLLSKWIQLTHRVLVVLGPAEANLAATFQAQSLAVLSGIGLGELAGIARLARGFVGNDSGVSHLAAAAGAIGVVIFGPTNPECWRPLGDVKILRKEPLRTLPPDQVWSAVAELFGGSH
jgi:heptosyltransferase-2